MRVVLAWKVLLTFEILPLVKVKLSLTPTDVPERATGTGTTVPFVSVAVDVPPGVITLVRTAALVPILPTSMPDVAAVSAPVYRGEICVESTDTVNVNPEKL